MTERAAAASPGCDLVLAEGMRFAGLLVLPRAARIDGHFQGEIQAVASVEVGASGVVEGDLEAAAVTIAGRVEGDVRARAAISLGASAVVHGDLAAPRLAMAEGAQVEGRCQCGDPPAPRADPTADSAPASTSPATSAS